MSAAAVAAAAAANAAAAAAQGNRRNNNNSSSQSIFNHYMALRRALPPQLSRYESMKRQDWVNFVQYLQLCEVQKCKGEQVVEYFRSLDELGQTRVHDTTCSFYGHLHQSERCDCPLRLEYSSLESMFQRLRVAFVENFGLRVANPFGSPMVTEYLREVRDSQAIARGLNL